ncbi:hypothetical protein J5277_29260 [Rhizobium sp. 16-449-1b]|uniref:hypothetical protein n=1 Tax=Rhizobium sp. 16-449-1b TaxID=2819989 RepID=UPI001ADD5D7B|nr:hypothetical protein [Rhizobium sp. 16-449-1b]MBO9198223.1 hypothetical protein [Rhizobium sp. 16-449-1b]
MRLLTSIMTGTLIVGIGVARADCDPRYEEDLKPRVTSQIAAALSSSCTNIPRSALTFEYFGSWTNSAGDLVVQQVFYVGATSKRKSALCVDKIVTKLKSDAEKGVAPRCGRLLAHEASWLPDADSGPSILFNLRDPDISKAK